MPRTQHAAHFFSCPSIARKAVWSKNSSVEDTCKTVYQAFHNTERSQGTMFFWRVFLAWDLIWLEFDLGHAWELGAGSHGERALQSLYWSYRCMAPLFWDSLCLSSYFVPFLLSLRLLGNLCIEKVSATCKVGEKEAGVSAVIVIPSFAKHMLSYFFEN